MQEEKKQYLQRSYLYPIVHLERVLSSRIRLKLYKITVGFLIFFLCVLVAIIIINEFSLSDENIQTILSFFLPKIIGLVFLLFAFWIIVYSLEAFFRSYYFKEKENTTITGRSRNEEDMYSFHVLRILLGAQKDDDITGAFAHSIIGKEILHRTGVYDNMVESFLSDRGDNVIAYSHPKVSMERVYTLIDLAEYVFDSDPAFADFLFSQGAQKAEFMGATQWVVNKNEKAKQEKRWWTKEKLEKIAGVGADWSYGQAYTLGRFATEISGHEGGTSLNALSSKGAEYVQQLKNVLSRTRESNILLVGEPGEGKMDVVHAFVRDVHAGAVPLALERKKPMLFDGAFVVSQSQNKNDLEVQLIKIFNDAVTAGNIILVMNNLPSFVLSAKEMGSDIIRLIEPYFNSPEIQIIALSNKDNYHQILEQDSTIKQRFEHMYVERPDDNETVGVLQQVAEELEAHSGVLFSYGAVKEVIKAVYDHFPDPVMPDKAINILVELPSHVIRKRKILVEKQDVYEIIEQKTGIPLGRIEEKERESLLNIEEGLHQRVVGQDEAIRVVSNAMRRSRAGVRDTKRPIGSFLFIGPTGVGKTETAKALAQLFFENENNMTRLDMSEYTGEEALPRLIGSFEGGKVGILTKTLRERPYGVVLLDEFEKSSKEVHDLFLQILDEGFFSDVKGKRVNARNVIFIATSNAGSSLIFEKIHQNDVDTALVRKEVVEYIIKERIFKPEFLNRFDAVVLFHPLELEHIEEIAGLMLDRLKVRLRGRGLDLNVTDDLVKYVARQGLDPIFGARPMNRYIQENVEQVVAEKFIKGEIKEGTKFRLTVADLVL